jgi:hypothetical protein
MLSSDGGTPFRRQGSMALHRDIYWVGRQWAVTGHGIQACNQKQRSQFDIKATDLWEEGVLERIRAESWLNLEDFEKALAVARKQHPEPPGKALPSTQRISAARQDDLKQIPPVEISAEVATPAPQNFELRVDSWPAKFVREWRIRVRR